MRPNPILQAVVSTNVLLSQGVQPASTTGVAACERRASALNPERTCLALSAWPDAQFVEHPETCCPYGTQRLSRAAADLGRGHSGRLEGVWVLIEIAVRRC